MKQALHFAIIRFMPFAETQEFANVGILAYAPKSGFIGYKLAPSKFKRVSDFFEDLDGKVYSNVIGSYEQELEYLIEYAKSFRGEELVNLFKEITRVREGIIIFSDTGVVLSNNFDNTIDTLFDSYIGRTFKETKEYREQLMARSLKKVLKDQINVRYKEQSLDTGFGKFKLPLVATEVNQVKAIKPLAFDQRTPMQLADHGERWISRVKHLLHAKTINEDNFLFVIEEPKSKKDDFLSAFNVVKSGMDELGVTTSLYSDKNKILDFAAYDFDCTIDDFHLVRD